MKRVILFMLLMAIVVMTIATPVYASFWGSVKSNVIGVIVSGVFAVLTVIFGTAVLNYKKLVNELLDVLRAIKNALDEKSPGGKKILPEEYEVIFKELVETFQAALAVLPEKWKNKIIKA